MLNSHSLAEKGIKPTDPCLNPSKYRRSHRYCWQSRPSSSFQRSQSSLPNQRQSVTWWIDSGSHDTFGEEGPQRCLILWQVYRGGWRPTDHEGAVWARQLCRTSGGGIHDGGFDARLGHPTTWVYKPERRCFSTLVSTEEKRGIKPVVRHPQPHGRACFLPAFPPSLRLLCVRSRLRC